MAVHSKSYQKGYSAGFVIGELIGKTIKFFFSLLWDGIVKASLKCKVMLIAYVLLTLFAVASYLINQTCTFPVMLILITSGIAGIFIKIEEYPAKQRIKNIYKMFEEINLKASDNSYPEFLYENKISDYGSLLAFESMIPNSVWESKQELMEMHLNTKIINIKQDKNNNRITYVVTETKPLPTKIEWYTEYMNQYDDELEIGMGYAGLVGLDLNRYAHALVCGETGSGKSNILKCLIFQAIQKNYDVVLIDFKRGVSFSDFNDLITVFYDHFSAKNVLEGLVKETEIRLDLFRNTRVDNLIDYNKVSTNKLQRKIVFIDELTELLKVNDKELSKSLYASIETLARLSRSAGIHLILGIQRPDSTIINGQIKNNVSFRICGRFVDPEPSRIVLGHDDACKLPDIKGRVIVSDDGRQEVQSFYYRNKLQYNHSVSQEMQIQSAELKEEVQEKDLEIVDKLNFDFSDM